MNWKILATDVYAAWFGALAEAERRSVIRIVTVLASEGPTLPFPYSSSVGNSRHGRMRELRIQHQGRPYRVLYAFDPVRDVILLLGGDETGDARGYDRNVPTADDLYDEHVQRLGNRGLI